MHKSFYHFFSPLQHFVKLIAKRIFVLFSVVCGMCETEYGYVSANELASIEIDGAKFGMNCKFHVCQAHHFQPTKLKDICHADLQEFLNRIYPKEK